LRPLSVLWEAVMDSSSPGDLAARVSRLESSIWRSRIIALAVVVIAFATAQTSGPSSLSTTYDSPIIVRDAAGGAATLSASGLRVLDASGKERTFIGVDPDGRPSVDLADSGGRLRESMYLLDDLPVLRQFDIAGKRRAEIRLDSVNDGELLLSDQNEKLRLALFRTSSGDPQLGLYGSDEKLRAYFSTDDVSPYLVMRDAAGTTRVYAGGYKDGAIGMDIRDAANTILWKAP
jgi:hypothetical protein